MSLARFTEAGPQPPLARGEFLRCLVCGDEFDMDSPELPFADGSRKECPSCGPTLQTKGFSRHRRGSTFAEQWPGARRITTLASSLILHLDKLGLDHYDLAIIAYYEAHRFGGASADAFPSQKRIAAKTGMSKRQVQDRINRMVERGLCAKKHRWRGDGSQTSFSLLRIGLTLAAEYIEKNELPDGSVPGLDAFLDKLGDSTGCHPGVHPLPGGMASGASQEEAPEEEAPEEEAPCFAGHDSRNRGLTVIDGSAA